MISSSSNSQGTTHPSILSLLSRITDTDLHLAIEDGSTESAADILPVFRRFLYSSDDGPIRALALSQ
jgi:hypothetical protein